jgi:hypothetical protein
VVGEGAIDYPKNKRYKGNFCKINPKIAKLIFQF